MNVIHIKEIVEDITLGCTGPMRAITDFGKNAVIKVFHNGQGDKVLFNEFFAYKLAHILDIPTPEYFIGEIDKLTSIKVEFDERNTGYCFCSQYIDPVTTILPETLKWIENKDAFKDIIMFDHLIYNADRNSGNLILTIKPKHHLYAIDYSHIFIDGESWNRYLLQDQMDLDMATDRTIMISNAETYQMFISAGNLCQKDLISLIETKYSKLSKETFYAIIDATPKEWKPSTEDCEALVNYLESRLNNLEKIIKVIFDK